jgi:Protein of unknown function (DUF1501)
VSQNRRAFLKNAAGLGAGLMFHELAQIYFGTQKTLFKQAFAETGATKRYVNFHLDGGPPRWLFDQWLTPYEADPVLSSSNAALWNPGIATAITGGNYDYKTVLYRGVRVPHHYDVPVLLSTGSTKLSDLLDNMAVIRGYNSLTDGHEVNAPLQLYPDPASPSLSGLAADQRTDRIAGVTSSLSNTHPFFSGAGKSPLFVSDHSQTAKGGSLYGLMKAFQRTAKGAPGLTNLDSINEVMAGFEAATKAHLKSQNMRAGAMADHLSATKDLSMLAVQSLLVSNWNALFTKYQTAMLNAARFTNTTIAGVNSEAVTFPAGEFRNFNGLGDIDTTYDLRQMVTTANASGNMMRSFVIAEYCLKNDICGSLCLGAGDFLSNLQAVIGGTTRTGLGVGTDQHDMPARTAVLLSTSYFRAFGAAMLELVNALKATPMGPNSNVFNDTLIHVTSDFGRSPKYSPTQTATYNLSGTDHGWQGQVASLISGAIDKPMIVGNITATHNANGYKGLWGFGSAVDFNGSKEILSPRHAAAVVAHVLGGKNPWSFTHLAYKMVNGKLEATVKTEVT